MIILIIQMMNQQISDKQIANAFNHDDGNGNGNSNDTNSNSVSAMYKDAMYIAVQLEELHTIIQKEE